MLMPRQTTPALQVPTLQHGPYDLATDSPEHFSLLVFYRGLHCPICMKYLLELARLVPEFEKRGVKVLALSSDNQDRAEQMAQKINMPELRIRCPHAGVEYPVKEYGYPGAVDQIQPSPLCSIHRLVPPGPVDLPP